MSVDDSQGRRPLRHSLALRFGLVLCLGAAVLFLLFGWWNVTIQRRHMVRLAEQSAAQMSSLVRTATHDGMLQRDIERVGRVVSTLVRSEGVHHVRILDRDGLVRYSSVESEVGQSVPITEYQCQICHTVDPVPATLTLERRMREIEAPDGQLHLHVVEPVPNEPSCSSTGSSTACHPADRRVLGVIDVYLPLGEVVEQLEESEIQLGIGLLVSLLALLVLAGFLTWRMVIRPVRELVRGTEKVAAGDLTTRVPVHSQDEIGRMASSWNTMVGELQKARSELEEWSQRLGQRVAEQTHEIASAHERMLVVEKMAALGKLAAVVAHEINNPLTGIATYARLLLKRGERSVEGGPFDADALMALELMETEATRCGNIVRNLLLFSRTPGARFAEEDLGPILERCVLLVRHKADLQEVEIVTRVADDLPKVECDAAQVQQVILALTMNGIEAMPEGGTLSLALAKDRDADGVLLEIADTGVGIPPEALPHVYEPFFTTKEQGEGVGLGLSVVYGIVERHHASLSVESEPGEGTRFRVHLPRVQPAAEGEAGTGGEEGHA